ncbi:MAG: DUF962 domain-containing protein [Myxococcota bacterium]
MSERVSNYEEFWKFYLSEHRHPLSRRLHFLGTGGWFASLAASAALNPIGFPLAMAGFGLALKKGLDRGESESPSLKHVLVMLGIPSLASPVVFPAGVMFAYGCAWVGHFRVEHNRPATFKYPLWSLVSDWKMWAEMAQGRLWDGDPLEELGLELSNDDPPTLRVVTDTAAE